MTDHTIDSEIERSDELNDIIGDNIYHDEKELRERLENISYPMSPKINAKLKEMVPKEVIDKLENLIAQEANKAVVAELESLPRFTDTPSGSQVAVELVAWHDIQDRINQRKEQA